jgi:hypothetical protein
VCIWFPFIVVTLVANTAVGWWAGVLPFQSPDLERMARLPAWLMFGPIVLMLVFIVAAFTMC